MGEAKILLFALLKLKGSDQGEINLLDFE